MFSKLYTENFRNLSNEEISFRTRRGSLKQAAFFFGDNGVGKTSIIYALGFLKCTTDAFLYNFRIHQSNSTVQPFNLRQHAQQHTRLGAKGALKIHYELIIDKELYIYTLEFTPEGTLEKEVLFRKVRGNFHVLFSYTGHALYLCDQEFSKSMEPWLRRQFNEHIQNYTFLSLIYYGYREDIIHPKNHLCEFLKRLGRYHLQHESFNHQDHFNIVENQSVYATHGISPSEFELFQNAGGVLVTQVAKVLYPNIDHVRYKYEKQKDGKLAYQLMTYIKVGDQVQLAQNHQLPKSYFSFLEFCFALLDLLVGNAVVYDDMDALFSSETLKYFIKNITQKTSAQVMMTFNTPELLNYIDPIFAYIFIENNGLVSIRCIDDIEIIRDSHNILKRYESGQYNHYVPINESGRSYKLLMWFDQYVTSFKKKIGL